MALVARDKKIFTPCVRVNGMFEELIRGALTISLGGAVITSCRSFQELKSFLKM